MPNYTERSHRQKYIDQYHPFLVEIPKPTTCIGCSHYMGARIIGIDLICGHHINGYPGLYCPEHEQLKPNTEWDLQ